MSFDNMGWGLQMMVLGMGIVFSLLALLWALLVVVLHFDREAAPAVAEDATHVDVGGDGTAAATAPAVPSVNGMEADLVAAILVAAITHKNVLRGQAAPAMRSYSPGSQRYASRWLSSGRTRQNPQWQRRGG